MSLGGAIASRAPRVTVKRATSTDGDNGSTVNTWNAVATSLPMLIDDLSVGEAQKMFGLETKASARGLVAEGADVQAKDGVIVTDGARAGEHYRVAGLTLRGHERGLRYRIVGLERTTETFA